MSFLQSCPQCGASVQINNEFTGQRMCCPACGGEFTAAAPAVINQPAMNQAPMNQTIRCPSCGQMYSSGSGMPGQLVCCPFCGQQSRTPGIPQTGNPNNQLPLIFGILSIPLSIIPIVGLGLGITALVQGLNSHIQIAVILGSIGMGLSVLLFIIYLASVF